MSEKELLCDSDGTEIAEWSCICAYPLKKICRLHKEKHLSEPLQPGAFHYLLPISATRIITTPNIFSQKKPWVYGLAERQRRLRDCLEPLSRFSAEMNHAFEDLRYSLSERQEHILNKVYREFEHEVQTAIEETSRHGLEPFEPAPGLQSLIWSEETKSADFPTFNWRIETNPEALDNAFTVMFDKVFPESHHTTLTFGNLELFQQELDKLKGQLAKEVEEHKNEVHNLNIKYQEEILQRGKNEALIDELTKKVKDTDYESYNLKCTAEKEKMETHIDKLGKQLQSVKNFAVLQNAEALQWKGKYKQEVSKTQHSTLEIDGLRKQLRNVETELEVQKSISLDWEKRDEEQQSTIDDLRTQLQSVEMSRTEAIQGEKWYKQQQSTIDYLRKQLQHAKKEAERLKVEAIQREERGKQAMGHDLRTPKRYSEAHTIGAEPMDGTNPNREKQRFSELKLSEAISERRGSKMFDTPQLKHNNSASKFLFEELPSVLSPSSKLDSLGKKVIDEVISGDLDDLKRMFPPTSPSYTSPRGTVQRKSTAISGKCRSCNRNTNTREDICNACRAKSFEHWTCPNCSIENTSEKCSKCGRLLVS